MVKNIFSNSFKFIKKYFVDITLVVLALIIIAIYNVMNDIHYKQTSPVLQRVIVMENLENKGVCNGGLQERDKTCQELLTKKTCNELPSGNCCVWAKKNKTNQFKCLGGDKDGPTYDGHNFDQYYYQNKLYSTKKNNKL